MRAQPSNSRSRELRVVLAISPSRCDYVWKALTRRSHTHIASQVSCLEKEESRVFDSRTRELRKALALRASCGRMET
jgi:hypothetical protein